MDLFHEEYGTYNDDALALDIEAAKVLKPLFDKYVRKGCRLKEIAYIITSTVSMEEMERRLTRNSKIAKAKRDNRANVKIQTGSIQEKEDRREDR